MRDATNTYGQVQDGAELIWVKPKRSKGQFELRAGDTIVATLVWDRGTRAVAQWGERRYHMSRRGWLRPRVLVSTADSGERGVEDGADTPVAMFAQHGGLLSFPDGRVFFWKKPKWLTRERIWVDSAAAELVHVHPARRATVVVTAQPEAARLPELPLLILLGQYLIVLASQDAEAAGTAAATAAIVAAS
jgi:hypothetical protein